ncbi:sensor histidine kinase [Brotaphodocola sp.]|uniref:sensor histidine kinase n=1 Tax=Brotaphodocola sp. TaxID=3073577 RepID=UPI003D7D93CE
MIRKLQIKLISISMISLILVMSVILGVVNLLNYRHVVLDADHTLAFLAENDGEFPRKGKNFDIGENPEYISPELARVSRYFCIELDSDDLVCDLDVSQIAAVDEETAAAYAKEALELGKSSGFLSHYRYLVQTLTDEDLHENTESTENIEEETGNDTVGTTPVVRIIFLDCWRSLSNAHTFFLACVWTAICGLVAVLILMILLSKWILRPFSENYEKQRRFITDAGHEIKTPLAIIEADSEILEMDIGDDNEWLQDIRQQTKRLTSLTNDLIYLSRMEEAQNQIQMIEFPFSDLAEETVQSFQTMAKAQNKNFSALIDPRISVKGDQKSLRQLISVLLDNALKYSEENGNISLSLRRQGRYACLTVTNSTADPISLQLDHLFDRFYRGDESRNSKTGGYGIGLSIASAVTANHKGKISATSPDPHTLTITVMIPACPVSKS